MFSYLRKFDLILHKMSNILLRKGSDGYFYWLFTTIQGRNPFSDLKLSNMKELIYTILHISHKVKNPDTYKGIIFCWVDYQSDSLTFNGDMGCEFGVSCEVISFDKKNCDKHNGLHNLYWLEKLQTNALQIDDFQIETQKFAKKGETYGIEDTVVDSNYIQMLGGMLEEINNKISEDKVEVTYITQKFPF